MENSLTRNTLQEPNNISVNGLDHIAIVVPDLVRAIEFYRKKFGCVVTDPVELSEQSIRIAYVELGNAKLELMEPLGPGSPISKFLEKHPSGGMHHFCLTTQNAFDAAKSATDSGMQVLGEETLTTGHHGRKLFFIHPKDTLGSLIEIEESVSSNS